MCVLWYYWIHKDSGLCVRPLENTTCHISFHICLVKKVSQDLALLKRNNGDILCFILTPIPCHQKPLGRADLSWSSSHLSAFMQKHFILQRCFPLWNSRRIFDVVPPTDMFQRTAKRAAAFGWGKKQQQQRVNDWTCRDLCVQTFEVILTLFYTPHIPQAWGCIKGAAGIWTLKPMGAHFSIMHQLSAQEVMLGGR